MSTRWIYILVFCINIGCHIEGKEHISINSISVPEKYYLDIQYQQLDSITSSIQSELPQQLWLKACESIWYASPIRSISPEQQLQSLNILDRHFSIDSIQAFLLMEKGTVFSKLSRHDSAEICFKKAYDLSIKEHRLLRASDIRSEWGLLLVKKGDYPAGIKMLLESHNFLVQLGSENGDFKDGGRLFENMKSLGQAYREINDIASAIYWDKKNLQYAESIEYGSGYQIQIKGSLAENYWLINNLDSAQISIDEALEQMDKKQMFYNEGKYRMIKAGIATQLGRCETAQIELSKSLRDTAFLVLPKSQGRYFETQGYVYSCQNNVDSAIYCFKKALTKTDTIQQVRILNQLAYLSKIKQDFKQALAYTEGGNYIKTRLLTDDKNRSIERLRLQMETEKEVQAVQFDYQRRSLWYLIGVLSLFLAFVTTLFYFIRLKHNNTLIERERALAEAIAQLRTQELEQATNKILQQEDEIKANQQQLLFKSQLIYQLEISLAQKNETPIEQTHQPEVAPTFRGMRILTKDDWYQFKFLFDNYYPDFSLRLKARLPNLSEAELRLFLLIKTGFDNIEIADMLGVSPASVYKSRYRLRRKLGLNEEVSLDEFVTNGFELF